MPKPKPEKPTIGQTVKLRGREPTGVLKAMNSRGWASVAWTSTPGPLIVHIDELETINV